MKFKTATFCGKGKYHSSKKVKDASWKAWFVVSRPSLRGLQGVSEVFQSHVPKAPELNNQKQWRNNEESKAEWFCFFSSQAFEKGRTHQHWTKGKPLVLDSSCVHLGSQQRLLPTGTKGSHTQSNVKHRGGREDWSQREEAKTKTCFIVVNLGAAHWKGQGLTLSTTTHILQQSLGENMRQSWHSSAIHL